MVSIKVGAPKKRERAPQILVPHSWELNTWPVDVWPNDVKRGRWVTRAYRKELVAAGALSRVGKLLIVVGSRYALWLERRADHVVTFTSNNPNLGKSRPAKGVPRPHKKITGVVARDAASEATSP